LKQRIRRRRGGQEQGRAKNKDILKKETEEADFFAVTC
jgi:hypothetical protein